MSLVELCRIETPDGLLLDGAVHPAERTSDAPVDAVLLLHGTAGNFYAAGVLEEFATRSASAGVTAVRANTRGHDPLSRIPGRNGSRPGGAAYEVISECRHDVAGWLSYLGDRGLERVLLVGHSMGGVKAILTAAVDQPSSVKGVVAISAPRFHHARLASRAAFVDDYRRAVELVETGRGETLVPMREPLSVLLTASGVLAKYGPHDEYDVLRHLPSLTVPVLYVLGTQSVRDSVAFETLPTDLEELASRCPNLHVELVEGANTVYSGCPAVPFDRTWAWLAGPVK